MEQLWFCLLMLKRRSIEKFRWVTRTYMPADEQRGSSEVAAAPEAFQWDKNLEHQILVYTNLHSKVASSLSMCRVFSDFTAAAPSAPW